MLDMETCWTCGSEGCPDCNYLGFTRSFPDIKLLEHKPQVKTETYKSLLDEIVREWKNETTKQKD